MPSGALSLLEATKSSTDTFKKGVVQTIISGHSMIDKVPWVPFMGRAYVTTVEATLPNPGFRDVNEGYTQTFGTDTEIFWGVGIFGGEIEIDNFELNVTANKASLKAKQWAKMAKANAMRFGFTFFDGTGTAKDFKGVKTLISEGHGLTVANSTTGATIASAKLDEALDAFRNQGGPDEWLANRTVRRQITNLAKSGLAGFNMVDVEKNTLGKNVTTYDGVPISILEDVMNASGTVVAALPFTEDPGDATSDCCSLYAVKWGEDNVHGLVGAGGSMQVKDFGEQENGPQHLGRLEWYPGICIQNVYSIARITGITAV